MIVFLLLFKPSHQRRQWQPTPVLLPGKSHGPKSLVGYNPWSRKESDTTEQLHFHFSFKIFQLRIRFLQAVYMLNYFSCVQLFAMLWTIAL